jgi:hypothetical protein
MNPMFKSPEVVSRGWTNSFKQTNNLNTQSSETWYQSSGSPLLLYYLASKVRGSSSLEAIFLLAFEKRFKPWYSSSTLSIPIEQTGTWSWNQQISHYEISASIHESFILPCAKFPSATWYYRPHYASIVQRPPQTTRVKIRNPGRRVFLLIVIVFFPLLRRFSSMNASMCNSRDRACR